MFSHDSKTTNDPKTSILSMLTTNSNLHLDHTNGSSQVSRGFKGALIGGFFGSVITILLSLCFSLRFDAADILPGTIAGSIVGFFPVACLPKGFSLPKDITTITFLSIGAFCFWVLADGIVKGQIHGFPKGGFLKGFTELISWKEYPPIFVVCVLYWSGLGILTVGVPIYYFRKAIRETSRVEVSTEEKTLQNILSDWKTLPENTRAVSVFILAVSTILVFCYLLIILKS